MRKRGVTAILYARRELSAAETEEYTQTYRHLLGHPMSQSRELEALAVRWEEGLEAVTGDLLSIFTARADKRVEARRVQEFLGIVGVRKSVRDMDGVEDFCNLHFNCGAASWLLSGDHRQSVLNFAHSAQYF
jgi:hypothetical protein